MNLTQTRWSEFLKDYDINFQYHSRQANAVADVLSRRPYSIFSYLLALPKDMLCSIKARPIFIKEIQTVQCPSLQLERIKEEVLAERHLDS